MTLPVKTEDIMRLYDSGMSIPAISKELVISIEAVRYRLKKAGYTPRTRRANVTKESVRKLREHMPALVSIQQFLEAERRDLRRRIDRKPTPEALDRLGNLNDFIMSLGEVTA